MKEGYTKKLYWGKWSHKAVVKLCQTNDAKMATLIQYKKDRTELRKFMTDLGLEFKTLESTTWVDSVPNPSPRRGWSAPTYLYVKDNFLTVYFKDASVLDKLLADKKFGPMITYVEKPFSEGHLEALEVERMVVRKTLWWDRYRYAARMKSVPAAYAGYSPFKVNPLKDEIRDWIQEQLIKACKRVEGVDYKLNESGYYATTIHLYFVHAQDAMMFRLAFGQHIKHNERIKLMSELKDAPQVETNETD